MSEIQDVVVGLSILSQYDRASEVNIGSEQEIYAGPNGDRGHLHPEHRRLLELHNWRYDSKEQRWYWPVNADSNRIADGPTHELTSDGHTITCSGCGRTFAGLHEALTHADKEHPQNSE